MPAGLKLGVQEPVVHGYLKTASVGWDQRNVLYQMLELLEEFVCQAHGPVCVVSDRAVNNLDLQHKPSLSKKQVLRPGGGTAPGSRPLNHAGNKCKKIITPGSGTMHGRLKAI
jgi:hypothetical protein